MTSIQVRMTNAYGRSYAQHELAVPVYQDIQPNVRDPNEDLAIFPFWAL